MKKGILVFLCLAAVVACSRNGNGYHEVQEPPPPPAPPSPVNIMVSLENSSFLGPYFDSIESQLTTFLQKLNAASVSFQLACFRSTENQDGNYDSRAQGPTPIISSGDKDVGGELHADMQALHGAYLGSAPLPVDILAQAASDPRVAFPAGVHTFLITFSTHDASRYELPDSDMGAIVKRMSDEFDSAYHAGDWLFYAIDGPALPGNGTVDNMLAEGFFRYAARSCPGCGVYGVTQDYSWLLAETVINWSY